MSDLFSLEGKRGLVVGVANEASIAWACARAFRELGAQLAMTYLNDKARPHVEPLAQQVAADPFLPCDVREPGQLESVFERLEKDWGRLDFVLHSIAFAPLEDLHGRVVDSSREGFLQAMDISCHSFLRMARLAEPLMDRGGTMLTVSFYGAEKVVEDYNLMGPVKAALEEVRYAMQTLGIDHVGLDKTADTTVETRVQNMDDSGKKSRLGRAADKVFG